VIPKQPTLGWIYEYTAHLSPIRLDFEQRVNQSSSMDTNGKTAKAFGRMKVQQDGTNVPSVESFGTMVPNYDWYLIAL
jgi:hypothetical protein